MSLYKDIIVIKDQEDCHSPQLIGEQICELLAHKNRAISGVKEISLNRENLMECIGKYCYILNDYTIRFSMEHYNMVFLPLWKVFKNKIQKFNFSNFTSEEGIKSLAFEKPYSPNIIYYDAEYDELLGMSLEDFFRSVYFTADKNYEVISLWCHHE